MNSEYPAVVAPDKKAPGDLFLHIKSIQLGGENRMNLYICTTLGPIAQLVRASDS